MTHSYTFWHSGILIGESDLEERSGHPGHRSGVFRPTAYGPEIFPRLTGILSAGHALKTHLDANGLSADDMDPREVEELLDTTPAGQKIIDVGRMLSDVEVRAPDGSLAEFASIGFIDTWEFERLGHELRGGEPLAEPHDPPPDASRYVASATFRRGVRGSRNNGKAVHFRRPRSSNDN